MAVVSPESARAYLSEVLEREGIPLKAASELLGLNHAYLQQYIEYGKPRWLPEPIRLGLLQILPLDEERLKPAPQALRPRPASGKRHNQANVDIPSYRELLNDPGARELLRLWDAISPDYRPLALKILRTMTHDFATSVAE